MDKLTRIVSAPGFGSRAGSLYELYTDDTQVLDSDLNNALAYLFGDVEFLEFDWTIEVVKDGPATDSEDGSNEIEVEADGDDEEDE